MVTMMTMTVVAVVTRIMERVVLIKMAEDLMMMMVMEMVVVTMG